MPQCVYPVVRAASASKLSAAARNGSCAEVFPFAKWYADLDPQGSAVRLPGGGTSTKAKVRAPNEKYVRRSFDAESAIPSLRAYKPLSVLQAFKRPAVLLDVGANVSKITFPRLSFSQHHIVIAVEPVKKNMDILCKTADFNHRGNNPNLILVQGVLSDTDSTFQTCVPEGRKDNSRIISDASTDNVDVLSHTGEIRTTPSCVRREYNRHAPDRILRPFRNPLQLGPTGSLT